MLKDHGMKTFKYLLTVIFLGSAFSVACATPIQWTLPTTQTSFSFAQAYGTFTFDADTNSYSDVALMLSYNFGTFDINSGNANGFNFGVSNSTGIYSFAFDTALTNAGGLVTGTESDHNGTHPFSVQAAPAASAVPEPQSGALLATGLGFLWLARRRKSAASSGGNRGGQAARARIGARYLPV